MRLIVVYYNNMSPERVESKRESMRNVEKFLYVNTIAAGNLNKIVANKLLVLLLSASPYFHMYNYITQWVYSGYDLNNQYKIVINTCTNLSDGLYRHWLTE